MSKICKSCDRNLPVAAFSKGKAVCKECRTAAARASRTYTCVDCGHTGPIEFYSKSRRTGLCPSCYIVHRKATNLLYAAKGRAQKKRLAFDLSHGWIVERLRQPCNRTGFPLDLSYSSGGKNISSRSPFSPSLDKIDPFGGYTRDNVQVVCWWYNIAKQQYTDQEVADLCRAVVKTAS